MTREALPSMHACGYPGCQKPVLQTKLACIEHWFSLPVNVREALWREYREAELAGEVKETHRHQAVRAVALAHWVFQAEDPNAIEKSRAEVERAKFHRRRALAKAERDPFEGLGLEDFFHDPSAFEDLRFLEKG